MRLKDRRRVELSKSHPALWPKPRKVSLRKYLECSSTPTAPATVTDDLPWNGRIPDLSVCTPSLDLEQMVDQLNQDPRADSVTDSDRETISVGGGRTDIAGDEEVECMDEGSTTQVAAGPGVTNLDWDPRDPLFKFNDENSGAA